VHGPRIFVSLKGGSLWLRLAHSHLFVFVGDDVIFGVDKKFSPLYACLMCTRVVEGVWVVWRAIL
jgi:hypothetical protein